MRKIDLFRRGGAERLQVITDFDYTLTKYTVNGSPGLSCHRLIEGSGFIPEHIVKQADAMFRYYYPIEISQTVPQVEKEKHMLDWATRAGELLQQSGIQRSEVTLAVAEALRSRNFALREHVPAFFSMLQKRQVPVLLFSAGIGDVIEETLKQQLGAVPQDVHVVSNHMIFGDAGRVVGWTEPVFHVFNKKASAAAHSPFFSRYDIAHRENVMLIGDSLGDVRMSDGLHFHPDSIIRIGYLNTKVERLNEYLAAFDVVIVGDPGFAFVNSLLENILEVQAPSK
jgi:5'-nucleotidase